jgi:hypothetical protein
MANAISLPLSVNARKKHFGFAMCFGRQMEAILIIANLGRKRAALPQDDNVEP